MRWLKCANVKPTHAPPVNTGQCKGLQNQNARTTAEIYYAPSCTYRLIPELPEQLVDHLHNLASWRVEQYSDLVACRYDVRVKYPPFRSFNVKRNGAIGIEGAQGEAQHHTGTLIPWEARKGR